MRGRQSSRRGLILMRAHGDSSASSVMDTFAEASDNSQANLNGGSSHRAALGQVKESCPAGR
jgi:hypothetical protein